MFYGPVGLNYSYYGLRKPETPTTNASTRGATAGATMIQLAAHKKTTGRTIYLIRLRTTARRIGWFDLRCLRAAFVRGVASLTAKGRAEQSVSDV